MAKKGFKFSYDSPVTVTFVIVSILIFILDTYLIKGKLTQLILSCCVGGTEHKFNGSDPLEYIRIFTHVLGYSGWTMLLINSTCILLCGPVLEERYGSFFIAIMTGISILVSGVLRQTLCPYQTTGSSCLVFMLILLSSVMAFSKKEIRISYILIFLTYSAWSLFECQAQLEGVQGAAAFFKGNIHTFIDLAAGLSGSLLGFLVAPKQKKETAKDSPKSSKKSQKKKNSSNEFSFSEPENSSSSEETVIGSIEF